ncbi:Uncharacterized protein K02A2.6 [Stylophora pistillata]|uniref:Uncharacterized protein K02A2.6 n=1 Tax=Stylophora pistillata TaxID=50429 RepID=A0A2B4R3S5_STYPI|nr:Uncharacterized protein K02A2.6 [Stylophora pistillata]
MQNTKIHSNADGLSRLPLVTEAKDEEEVDPVGVFNLMQFDPLPVTMDNARRETQRDPVLAQVHEMTRKGWPNNHDPVFNPYFVPKDEIMLQSGCLMWGIRVIVPPKLRPQVLKGIYQGHMGVVKMKALARSYTWWLGIDKEIELSAKSCPSCQLVQREPSTVPVHLWEWPSYPWQRIHNDFAGPFLNMSDNGPQFTSERFQQFLKRNGIKRITSTHYHPATNGLAERAVQSFKNAMKSETEVTSLNIKLARFLLTYRNTPHSTAGEPPSQLFLGRRLRTRLDLLKPDLFIQVNNRQIEQSVAKSGSVTRNFCNGQRVIARNYTGKSKWVPGIVRARLGPLSYEVEIGPDLVWRRHTDQLRDSNVPVADRHLPVSYPLPFPLPAATTDHPEAESPKQTEVVSRETDCQSPKCNPVADSSVSSSPSQFEHVPKPLLPEERSLLEKGPKFAPTPTNIPHKNILAEIEAAICHLPDDSKDTVRTSSAAILHRGRLPAHNNVSKEERKALNNLKKDQSRVVMKAEKGNRFVVMDRSDYDSKTETLLNDRSTYEVVPTSPFPRIEHELNALLLSLKRQLKIDELTYRKIH